MKLTKTKLFYYISVIKVNIFQNNNRNKYLLYIETFNLEIIRPNISKNIKFSIIHMTYGTKLTLRNDSLIRVEVS